MTSAEPSADKPRRKWGWVLLLAFVVQAVVFAVLIGQIARQMPSATVLVENPAEPGPQGTPAPPELNSADAERLRFKLALLLLAASTCSIVTLAGALIGLRRPPPARPDKGDDPPPTASGSEPR
jgi:hypothetical protein